MMPKLGRNKEINPKNDETLDISFISKGLSEISSLCISDQLR